MIITGNSLTIQTRTTTPLQLHPFQHYIHKINVENKSSSCKGKGQSSKMPVIYLRDL